MNKELIKLAAKSLFEKYAGIEDNIYRGINLKSIYRDPNIRTRAEYDKRIVSAYDKHISNLLETNHTLETKKDVRNNIIRSASDTSILGGLVGTGVAAALSWNQKKPLIRFVPAIAAGAGIGIGYSAMKYRKPGAIDNTDEIQLTRILRDDYVNHPEYQNRIIPSRFLK